MTLHIKFTRNLKQESPNQYLEGLIESLLKVCDGEPDLQINNQWRNGHDEINNKTTGLVGQLDNDNTHEV